MRLSEGRSTLRLGDLALSVPGLSDYCGVLVVNAPNFVVDGSIEVNQLEN
jgi:hypothetical protein